MSYQVLARKWRPASFREMVGQQHVLKALVNALDNDRLHHAYLFTGTRGVGKTTVARILAKCLNCETGVSSSPCGTCSGCLEVAEGRSVDLIEVDAASRTKVEDTRELLENVQYAPTRSRYKIYLIDEVHMLSNHSFNALLKTLEEPPPHAKFLLATTDPQKLPATVLSRCLQFNLKNMVPEQIVEHLQHILSEESIGFDRESLGLLSRAASGSMRDALSLTDQAVAFGGGALNEADVRAMLGTVDRGRVLDLVEAVIAGAPETVMQGVAAIAEHAPDFAATLDELISVFHQMTVAQMVPDGIDTTWSEQQRIVDLAQQLTIDDTQLFYQFAMNGRRDLLITQDQRIGLEMTLLRMIAFRPAEIIVAGPADSGSPGGQEGEPPGKKHEPPVSPVAATSEEPVRAVAASVPAVVSSAVGADSSCPDAARPAAESDLYSNALSDSLAAKSEAQPTTQSSAAADLPTPGEWPEFFESLGLVGITQNVALHCELVDVSGRQMVFVLDEHNATLFNPRQVTALQAAISQVLSAPVTVTIDVGTVGRNTPRHHREERAAARLKQAETSLAADEQLAALVREFDGEIVAGSIRPTN